jgi:SAM-dependent methyltransferase
MAQPWVRRRLFSLRYPGAKAGYPPDDLDLATARAIERELRPWLRERPLSRAAYGAWKEGILREGAPSAEVRTSGQTYPYREYAAYPGRQLMDEKLLEHFVSLELLGDLAGKTLVDVGSAASPFAAYCEAVLGAEAYTLDPDYPAGVHGRCIGAFAQSVPLPDRSVDAIVLHCALDHFEGGSDTAFVREAARLLRPGGRVVSVPLYLSSVACNLTDPECWSPQQMFDPGAEVHGVRGHRNRFGRFYSPGSLVERVIEPARQAGLECIVWRLIPEGGIVPCSYLRYGLELRKDKG